MDCSSPCAWMEAARASIPAPAPVRRTLAGQGISLARLMSVGGGGDGAGGHCSFPFVVAKQRLAASRGRASGRVGRGKAASQGPCCTEPERSAGGGSWVEAALGERRDNVPRPPLRRVCGDQRVRDGSRMAETPPYRRLGAQPESPAPKGRRTKPSSHIFQLFQIKEYDGSYANPITHPTLNTAG